MIKKFKWTIIFCLITPLLVFLSIILAGAGHGTYLPLTILFPYEMISALFQEEITIPFIIIGLFQYPIYGLLIDFSKKKKKTIILLLVLHLFLSTILIPSALNF